MQRLNAKTQRPSRFLLFVFSVSSIQCLLTALCVLGGIQRATTPAKNLVYYNHSFCNYLLSLHCVSPELPNVEARLTHKKIVCFFKNFRNLKEKYRLLAEYNQITSEEV